MDRARGGPNAGGGAGVAREKLHHSALLVRTGRREQGSEGGNGKNSWREWRRVEEVGEGEGRRKEVDGGREGDVDEGEGRKEVDRRKEGE